jgi:hypothetical protein
LQPANGCVHATRAHTGEAHPSDNFFAFFRLRELHAKAFIHTEGSADYLFQIGLEVRFFKCHLWLDPTKIKGRAELSFLCSFCFACPMKEGGLSARRLAYVSIIRASHDRKGRFLPVKKNGAKSPPEGGKWGPLEWQK